MYIETGAIEKTIYEGATKDNEKICEINEKGGQITNEWQDIHRDIWISLYKNKPKQTEKQGLLGDMLQEMSDGSDFQATRRKTIMNKELSTYASVLMSESFLDGLPEEIKAYEAKKKALEDEIKQVKQTLRDANQKMGDEQKAQFKNRINSLKQDKNNIQDSMEELQQEMRLKTRESMKQTKEKIDVMDELIEHHQNGGDSGGSLLDTNEIMEFFKMLHNNPDLSKIIELAGRMKNILVQNKFRKLKKTSDQTYEIGTGKNLRDTLPSELAYYKIPQTRTLFLKKYTEERLLVYKKKNKKVMGKGPIICCVDESASTRGNIILWEKGLAMALSEIAKKENRTLYWISFSDVGQIETTKIPKGKYNLKSLTGFLTHYFGNGTCFRTPLEECLKIISSEEEKADIIFLTDGESYLDEAYLKNFLKKKELLQTKLFTICLEGYSRTVRQFSDATYDLMKDGEDLVLRDLFDDVSI